MYKCLRCNEIVDFGDIVFIEKITKKKESKFISFLKFFFTFGIIENRDWKEISPYHECHDGEKGLVIAIGETKNV